MRPLSKASQKSQIAALCLWLATFWWSSVLVSEIPAFSILRAFLWIIHLGFALAIFHLFRDVTRQDLETLAKALLLGLVVYVPILVAHFAMAPSAQSMPDGEIIWTSALPGYLSVRLFGFYTATLAALAVGLLWDRHEYQREDWWLYAMLALSLTLTFWSGTRGGMLAVACLLLALPVLTRRRPSTWWLTSIVAIAIVAVAASELLFQPNNAFGISRVGTEPGRDVTAGRWDLWMIALDLIAQRPVLGWGESALVWVLQNEAGHQQPHNLALQLLLSWGAIATLAAAFLAVAAARILLRHASRIPELVPLLALVLSLLIMSGADGILYNPRTALLLFFATAMGLAKVARLRGDEEIFAIRPVSETDSALPGYP